MLNLKPFCPVKAQNAGLFVSRGTAKHPTRIIDSHELIFVKQGELDMWEEEQVFHLEAGNILHLWPGRRHGSTCVMPPNLKFYWIHFEVLEAVSSYSPQHEAVFAPGIKVSQVACMSQPERLERLFRAFLDDQENGVLRPDSANLLTMLMLVEVAQSVEEQGATPDNMNAVATWAHTFIRMNFDRPITAGKVAERIGYNADYLGRIYRQVYGHTLTEAIHRCRVSKACDFLLESSMTIEQIAQKCGFSDPDYFRRVFKRHMQVTPVDYRSEYSRLHVNTH